MPENRLLRSAITRIPASEWLRSYEAGSFKNDLVAGLSLAAFVIPESLAYASLAQLPPVTGMYCYLAAGDRLRVIWHSADSSPSAPPPLWQLLWLPG